MKKTIFILIASLIGISTFASNTNYKLPAKAVKLIKGNNRYPVTGTCACGGTVTVYSNCSGTVAQCSATWNASLDAACGCGSN